MILLAKWTSPLFSDIRNAIGKTAVFSSWKGRGYFREYVIPANPKTNPQKANRAVMTNLVKRFQSLAATPANKVLWNAIAGPWMISGYNIFVKYGRKSTITAVTGAGANEIDVTGKCGVPLDKAHFYAFAVVAETWSDEGAVPTAEFTDLTLTLPGADIEYTVYIGDSDAENDPIDGNAAITSWYPNTATGVADVATATSGA